MRVKLRLLYIVIIISTVLFPAYTQDRNDVEPQNPGIDFNSGSSPEDLVLFPVFELQEVLLEDIIELDPNLVVETRSRTGIPVSDETARVLYNALHDTAGLTEASYYSMKKEDYHPVFHQSFRIKSEEDMTRMQDPRFSEIPVYHLAYVFQEPSSFLEMISLFEYSALNNSFLVRSRNLTEVRFNFMTWVKVAAPKSLRTAVVLYPQNGEYTLYTLGYSKVTMIPGVRGRAVEAFENRAMGLASFYLDRFEKLTRGE